MKRERERERGGLVNNNCLIHTFYIEIAEKSKSLVYQQMSIQKIWFSYKQDELSIKKNGFNMIK